MKILFIGSSFGNAYLQYKALKDIYKKVAFLCSRKSRGEAICDSY